jgi:hypothetical protein
MIVHLFLDLIGNDGGIKHLWNVGHPLADYTAQNLVIQSSYSPVCRREIAVSREPIWKIHILHRTLSQTEYCETYSLVPGTAIGSIAYQLVIQNWDTRQSSVNVTGCDHLSTCWGFLSSALAEWFRFVASGNLREDGRNVKLATTSISRHLHVFT